jgi:prepilin signal peptidase PulO-like enzyme (type II secretory pathway)
MGLSFLGSCYLIYKISEKIFPENKLLNLAFFALNPLVLIECLVSSHNDIPMIFFFLLSIYLFLQKKKISAFVSNIFSIGVKFSTGVIFPLFIVLEFFDRTKRKINWELFFVLSFLLSLSTIILATLRTTFQPWYLIFPLSIAAFVPKKFYIFIPSVIATIFGLSIYVPYVYMTDYAKAYPLFVGYIEIAGFMAIFLFTLLYWLKLKISPKH